MELTGKQKAQTSITEGEWDSRNMKWKKQPSLLVDGKKYTYPTPHGYIEKLKKEVGDDKDGLAVTESLEAMIPHYGIQKPLKKNFFTYFAYVMVLIPLTLVIIDWVISAWLFRNGGWAEVLPLGYGNTKFFSVIAMFTIPWVIITIGFPKITPLVKDKSSGKLSESMDIGDQGSAAIETILAPFLKGLAIAVAFYFAIYGILQLLDKISVFILIPFFIGVYSFFVYRFFISRPVNKRKMEVLWFFKWLIIGYMAAMFSGSLFDI